MKTYNLLKHINWSPRVIYLPETEFCLQSTEVITGNHFNTIHLLESSFAFLPPCFHLPKENSAAKTLPTKTAITCRNRGILHLAMVLHAHLWQVLGSSSPSKKLLATVSRYFLALSLALRGTISLFTQGDTIPLSSSAFGCSQTHSTHKHSSLGMQDYCFYLV